MIGIHTSERRLHDALAELPLSARRADGAQGAIVAVPGEAGWVDAALAAVSAGAVALVISDPVVVPAGELRRLEKSRILVIVERTLLRPDVARDAVDARAAASDALPARMLAADARAAASDALPARILAADVSASRAGLAAATRDAVGWLRIVAGESLELVAAGAGLALLKTSAGIPATLTAVVTGRADAGRIRVQGLGEVTTDIEVEGRAVRLATSSLAGRLFAPTRFESSGRLALRRALEAVAADATPSDLNDLIADTDLAERVAAAPS
ncbi:MAG: hypothetical protein ABWY37_01105 [Microbacterium pygmaeum]